MRISDWSSDVCSSDLVFARDKTLQPARARGDRRAAENMQARCNLADQQCSIWQVTAATGFQEYVDGLLDARQIDQPFAIERKSVVYGKSVAVRGESGGRRIIKKKRHHTCKDQRSRKEQDSHEY